jgi:CheY-like chemotaxis protein
MLVETSLRRPKFWEYLAQLFTSCWRMQRSATEAKLLARNENNLDAVEDENVLVDAAGQEALRMIEQTHPDILLLDIGMPVLDGFAVIRKIRESPTLATLPVLAVTADAMQGDRETVLNGGFDGYLSKPINPRDLATEIERLLHVAEDRHAPPPSPCTLHAHILGIRS